MNEELAAAILQPYFDAVRDTYLEWEGGRLKRLKQTRLFISESAFDGGRHFAGCRDDGLQIMLAPQLSELPEPTVVAIITHEFAHAADFLYPGRWAFTQVGVAAAWVPSENRRRGMLNEEQRRAADAGRAWLDRSDDQVEWTADAVAQAVTGRRIQYCGPCLIQCFSGGVARPAGLR